MKQHKWHKEIKAWANGAMIQVKDSNVANEWVDIQEPLWEYGLYSDGIEYRIKPQPKEPQYLYAYLLEVGSKQGQIVFGLEDSYIKGFSYIGKIKLEDTENE